jgi:hypothetical protein
LFHHAISPQQPRKLIIPLPFCPVSRSRIDTLTARHVKTTEPCINETCVSEDQLKVLLAGSGAAGNAPVGGSPGTAGGSSAREALDADDPTLSPNNDDTATTTAATSSTPVEAEAQEEPEAGEEAPSAAPEAANDNDPLPEPLATGTE